MIGIVLASHGGFAQGLYDTILMLTGEMKSCKVVSLQPGMTPEKFDELLMGAVREVDTGEGVIIFTDIPSGTPYNRAVGLKHLGMNIEVVSGANVPMVIDLAYGAEGGIGDCVEEAIQLAKEGIKRVAFTRGGEEDEDDF